MVIIGAALTVLLFYFLNLQRTWTSGEIMNRAQAARMLALMHFDREACEVLPDSLPGDVREDDWYGKYVSVVLREGWMNVREDGGFHPGDTFTYGDLAYIMEQFHLSEANLSFSTKYRQKDGMVPRRQWCEVYRLLCVNSARVTRETLEIYGSPENIPGLGAWQVVTDQGIKMAEGLSVGGFVHRKVEAYMAGEELLCFIEVLPGEYRTETGTVEEKIEETMGETMKEAMKETMGEAEKAADESRNIRVLLHGSDAAVYEQPLVSLTSEEAFIAVSPNEVTRYEAGAELTLTPENVGNEGLRVKTESGDGKIQVLSLERNCGAPSYRGEICIQPKNGGLLVINEVNLEDYVAGVIPGEMPVSYGEEALKVQAVCARTFAYRALGGTFRDYPAHLDDTVASRVYNQNEECPESIQAVSQTRGQVLKNSEGLTATYFFSTSCGHTSDPEDVWYNGDGEEKEAAVSVFLSDDTVTLALSREADFRKFIDREDGYNYFEEDLPWFRWQVYLPAEDICSGVEHLCQTNIGELESVAVLERADSGLIKAVEVTGSENQCRIYGEYKIRQALSPVNVEIIPQSGESVTGWELLPSAYCYMEPVIEENRCLGYLIRGGGYGHGSGMSQNGAMKMAEMGKNYEEILKYFFPDSELNSK